ncbi:MAG: hypothetical protein AAF802_02245 [Planctomycetota bacterium]
MPAVASVSASPIDVEPAAAGTPKHARSSSALIAGNDVDLGKSG